MLLRRLGLLFALLPPLLLAAGPAAADFPPPPSPEAEALFARAADALDRGDRASSDAALQELRRLHPLPVWEARIALLLGKDALDRGSASLAAELLSCADAGPIGLEAYRLEFLGEALEKMKETELARFAYLRAASLGSAACRAPAALAFARLARSDADERLALAILEQAGEDASEEDLVALLRERERIAERRHDAAAASRAAADLLFRAPTRVASPELPATLCRRAESLRSSLREPTRLLLAKKELEWGDAREALAQSGTIRPAGLPAGSRADLFLLRARAFAALRRYADSNREARRVARDGSEADFAARLQLAENDLAAAERRSRRRGRHAAKAGLDENEARRLLLVFGALTGDAAPPQVRRAAFFQILRLSVAADDRASTLRAARELTAGDPNATWGFDALWRPVWLRISSRDYAGALADIAELATVYRETSVVRRLEYWRARCLDELGCRAAAQEIRRRLAEADPPDLYAKFASAGAGRAHLESSYEPFEATADFARVDELLRLRLYPEALWEADRLPESRSQHLRLAVAEFALGRFLAATSLVKSVFPQLGTAREGTVPDPWRRLYYPMDAGGLVESAAREFGLDRGLLLALVRQESAFNPNARSRAGASGLTQLMPATARRLSRALLKRRFRRTFLYDPGINARLGASYLRSLLAQFHGDTMLAVAAYNGGPGRVSRLLRESPGLRPDELLESLPAAETRDYVRRVLLYAESYRELYPEEGPRN